LVEYVIAKYIRLSIEDAKTDSLSIENQRLMLDSHIEKMNMPGVEVLEFVDNGHSGLNFERPAVQELLELVQLGRVNCILVKDFSRFGRNMIENGYYIERVFPLCRVRFIAISDVFDSNEHEGGTGGLDVAFKFLIHEQYSLDLSEKIRAAKRAKALRGEYVIKNCAFGFKKVNGRLEIDEPAAETVRLIFELYRNGHRLSEVAARLQNDKRPTPREHKKGTADPSCRWNASLIYTKLRDEQYIGTYSAGKTTCVEVGSGKSVALDESEWIRIPGHHPAIVDQVVFDAVRERIGQKSKPRRKQKAKARQRHSSAEHALKGRRGQAHMLPGNHLSPHPEQREQARQIEDAKRALYERFILGEICAEAFQAENATLGELLKTGL
jgi:DNA invertase Pin-like site-specific DNA recombinase